jgi:hypothetical protein
MPSELEIVAHQLYQATEELNKIQEDIKVFNAERSNLQNRIQADTDRAMEKVKEECAQLKADTKIECDKLLVEGNERLSSIKAKEVSAIAKDDSVSTILAQVKIEETNIAQERKKFEEYKLSELKTLEDSKVEVKNLLDIADSKNKEAADRLEKLKKAKYAFDNLEFQLDERSKDLDKREKDIGVLIEKNEGILQSIQSQKEAITVETDALKEILLAIKDQRAALEKDTSVNADLIKLDEKLKEISSREAAMDVESKLLADKQKLLKEQEQTNAENLRLIQIEIKKNDGKIATINKLREESIKDA